MTSGLCSFRRQSTCKVFAASRVPSSGQHPGHPEELTPFSLMPSDGVPNHGPVEQPSSARFHFLATLSTASELPATRLDSPQLLIGARSLAPGPFATPCSGSLRVILYAGKSDISSKVWKSWERREARAGLCLEGRSSRHCWMAA